MGKRINEVGSALQKLRLQHGYTQKRLCEVLKISYNTYIKVERQIRNPSFLFVLKILDFFNEPLGRFEDKMYGHDYQYQTRQDGDPIYKQCTRCRDTIYVTEEQWRKDVGLI